MARKQHCAAFWLGVALVLSSWADAAQGMATKPGEAPTLRQDHYNFIDYNDPQQADHLTKLQQQAEHHAAYNSGQGSASAGSARGKEDRGGRVPVLTILGMTIFMSAMAGFGAVPFFFCGKLENKWAGIANSVACGVMLAASFDLLHEGAPYSPTLTICGMILGAVFIKTSQEYLSQYEDASFEELSGADARKAMLIVGVMAAHAFGEGSGVGVSFSGQRGWAQGTLVTIAIGLHNIPEGMAVATVMVSKGAKPGKALFWSLFCAFPQALVAVPSYLFVETFQSLLPLALGFAAGCMIWILTAELMPDALEAAPHPLVATCTTLSAAWLQGLSMAIATLERPDGALTSPILADGGALTLCAICLAGALAPAAVAAAHFGGGTLPAMQAALGATAGVVGTLGAAGVVGAMAGGGGLGFGSVVMWAVAGAGAALVSWEVVFAAKSKQLEVKRSLEKELQEAQHNNITNTTQHWNGQGPADASYALTAHATNGTHTTDMSGYYTSQHAMAPPHQPVSVQLGGKPDDPANAYAGTNGYHNHGTNGGYGAQYNGNGWTPFSQAGGAGTQEGTHQQQGGLAAGAAGAWGAAAPQPYHAYAGAAAAGTTGPYERRSAAQTAASGGSGTTAAWDPGAHAAAHGTHPGVYHPYANGGNDTQYNNNNPSQYPYHTGQHNVAAGSTNADAYDAILHHHAADPQLAAERAKMLGLGFPLQGGPSPHGQAVRTALHAAVWLCVYAGGAVGLRVAAALAAHMSDVQTAGGGLLGLFSRWFVPLCLQGAPIGLACVGIGKTFGGAQAWPALVTAGLAVTSALLGMLISVAPLPLGLSGTYATQTWPAHWAAAAQAATAGALLAVSAVRVWPVASASKPGRAQQGLVLGALAAGGCQLVMAGLCAATPYCVK